MRLLVGLVLGFWLLIVHPYNKAPLLRRPDGGLMSCSLILSQLAFFLAPLIMNLSNLSIYLLFQKLFNAYFLLGTAMTFGS